MGPATRLARALAAAALLALPALALGQEDLDDALFGTEDDLFGDPIVTDVEQDPDADAARELLESETVTIGGSYAFAAELRLDLTAEEDEPTVTSGLTELRTRLLLDARPRDDVRGFVKVDLSYGTEAGAAFELRELFADVTLADTVFLRAGKQTLTWGVGVFFRPANLLDLERVDPEDPEAELAGPVAVKAQLPIDASNLTGYLILRDLGSGDELDLAARYEFLVEGFEVTVGGLVRTAGPWALMATGSGSIEDVAVFAAAVVQGNSDKRFVVRAPGAPLGVAAVTSDAVFVSGTLGARYRWTSEDERVDVTGIGQLLFNGLGYDDPSVLTDDPFAIAALLAVGELRPRDLVERGRFYAAVSVAATDLLDTDLNPSLFWLGNLDDGSGTMSASVRWDGLDPLRPSLGYRLVYGAEGEEFSPFGGSHVLTLGVSLRGSF